VVVRTGIWIGAGVVGSIIGYETLVLIRFGLPGLDAGFLTTAFSVNFAAVLLASVAGTAVSTRRQGRMLQSQQQLLTDEFRAAYRMQQTLLPDAEAGLYGFDICAAMLPAVEVGGDYYDYITFADGSKGILVADASGKGVPAALMMAKFQGMAQALASYIADPGEFFVGLNDTLRVRLDRQSFITVGMVTIDFDDKCAFWRAGHNELLHYHAADANVTLRRPPGLALGLTHGGHLSSMMTPENFSMKVGDVLLLFSDGLSEACNDTGEEFGEHLLPDVFRRLCLDGGNSRTIRNELLERLDRFVGDQVGQDDVTIVVIRKVAGTGV
jgi:serine phosphatase RsbU (regulator of sigma subunit)